MEVIFCFFCNEQTDDWRRNFIELKSQHSNTPIVDFLKRFLNDFESRRNIENESNCICSKCLDRIDDYDWMCVSCTEKENELKELLMATEKTHREIILNEEREHELKLEAELNEIEMEKDCEIGEPPRPASIHEFLLVVPANGSTSINEPSVVLEVVYPAPIKPVELCKPIQSSLVCDRPSITSKRCQTSTMEGKKINESKKIKIPKDYKHSVF